MVIDNFPDPFITCCFINDDLIFVNLYHTATTTHHSFIYNHKTKAISSRQSIQLESNTQNFPYKCFYCEEENEIYTFYRQGESFRIPVFEVDAEDQWGKCMNKGKKPYYFQKIEFDLGQMYLINDKALIARSSSQVLFFKIEQDQFTFKKSWVNYRSLPIRGMIYFIKGNKRIQITTDKKIYFYLIDPVTFEPTLENVMNNFMNCTQMLFGSKVKYGITFKTNQKAFDIWTRRFNHNFMINVDNENLNGAIGMSMESMNAFLVGKGDQIKFFDI